VLQSEGILFHEDRACLAAVIQDRNNLQKHVQQAERRSLLDVRKAKRRQPSRGSNKASRSLSTALICSRMSSRRSSSRPT
jgi:hypothetical protein